MLDNNVKYFINSCCYDAALDVRNNAWEYSKHIDSDEVLLKNYLTRLEFLLREQLKLETVCISDYLEDLIISTSYNLLSMFIQVSKDKLVTDLAKILFPFPKPLVDYNNELGVQLGEQYQGTSGIITVVGLRVFTSLSANDSIITCEYLDTKEIKNHSLKDFKLLFEKV